MYYCLRFALWFSVASIGAMLFWCFSPNAAAQTYRPQLGERHPDFTLPAIDDGRAISLSQFRGKKVLLIHFASW